MRLRVAVIDNGVGQVRRLSYLGDIQMKIEQGNSLVTTVCMMVLVGYVFCLLVPKRPVAVFSLVSWPRGDGVPGRHPTHWVDPDIRDH